MRSSFLLASALVAACGSSTTVAPVDASAPHADATGPTPDAGADAIEDAPIADSGTPATSVDACVPLLLVPDAAPHSCEVSPSDVVCSVDSDCKVLLHIDCGCFSTAYGENVTSTVTCPPPPCVPPLPDAGCAASGIVAQNCQIAATLDDVGVHCVDHQCVTDVKVGAE